MKKRKYYLAMLSVCSMVLLSGCGKNSTKNNRTYNSNSNYTPSTTPVQTTTPALENAPSVSLNNLVVTAGSEIDYMSAIASVENMELSKSMVSINSSNVDRFTPGSYTVYYTFDYMGYTVKSFIVVTVVENPEATTSSIDATQESTEEGSAINSSEPTSGSSESSNSETSSEPNAETTSAQSENESTSPIGHSGALEATVYHEDLPIPDAVFTLSTGETVTIKNTPERYIVETFTDDAYYTEDGYHYLQSELKVLMNTGEVQTVEMVITRVSGIPEESPSESN